MNARWRRRGKPWAVAVHYLWKELWGFMERNMIGLEVWLR